MSPSWQKRKGKLVLAETNYTISFDEGLELQHETIREVYCNIEKFIRTKRREKYNAAEKAGSRSFHSEHYAKCSDL